LATVQRSRVFGDELMGMPQRITLRDLYKTTPIKFLGLPVF